MSARLHVVANCGDGVDCREIQRCNVRCRNSAYEFTRLTALCGSNAECVPYPFVVTHKFPFIQRRFARGGVAGAHSIRPFGCDKLTTENGYIFHKFTFFTLNPREARDECNAHRISFGLFLRMTIFVCNLCTLHRRGFLLPRLLIPLDLAICRWMLPYLINCNNIQLLMLSMCAHYIGIVRDRM